MYQEKQTKTKNFSNTAVSSIHNYLSTRLFKNNCLDMNTQREKPQLLLICRYFEITFDLFHIEANICYLVFLVHTTCLFNLTDKYNEKRPSKLSLSL